MSSVSFQVLYDGPALERHEMEVRDLAPALLALQDVFEEANRILNGERAKIALSVHASFKAGSFGVDMTVVQNLLDQTLSMFRSSPIAEAKELAEDLGFIIASAGGLVGVIKWLRGRTISCVNMLEDGKARIVVEEDDEMDVEESTLLLFRSIRLRNGLEQVIAKPLDRQGIDSFGVSDIPENGFVRVDKREAAFFRAPPDNEETIDESESETNLQLVSISFREDNKWRFSDGSSIFHAEITDESFMARVLKNEESFRAGDILHVRLFKRQWLAGENLKSEYQVVEVLDHRPAAIQMKLPVEKGK